MTEHHHSLCPARMTEHHHSLVDGGGNLAHKWLALHQEVSSIPA